MKIVFYRNNQGVGTTKGETTFSRFLLDYRFGKTFEQLIQAWREREEQTHESDEPLHAILADLSLAIKCGSVRVEVKP